MSTVGSVVYKVSEGYVSPQEIKGVKTNTTVSDFFASLVKANKGQSLKVTRGITGEELAQDALLKLDDSKKSEIAQQIINDSYSTKLYWIQLFLACVIAAL